MANSNLSMHGLCRAVWPIGCVLLMFGYFSVASPHHGRQLICWQAILNCKNEPGCNYAYDHYVQACEPVLSGAKKRCPSHCISSLVQLNLTKSGPALEDCSCGEDLRCARTKQAIEPCLPRTTSTGCTEARLQCGRDAQCSSAMQDYLHHCGKLFNGAICTNACRNVIANMRKIPKGQKLETCMCDGSERTICEFIKSSMKMLCFDNPDPETEYGSGRWVDVEDDDDDNPDGTVEPWSRASLPAAGRWGLTLLASILGLSPLL
ncbi:growth arrest-specific protein 1a [Poeciliopsis prolifica]|uniref:growth arrest-specific protein 1a n=1 Tax=Poeciliopsis prolifica TaxID=188132 RepID=UPI00072C6238|nr:growth arrest-specific protein 1a [Poeciliopsis prolifica]